MWFKSDFRYPFGDESNNPIEPSFKTPFGCSLGYGLGVLTDCVSYFHFFGMKTTTLLLFILELETLDSRLHGQISCELTASMAQDHWYETDGYFDQQQGPWRTQRASPWRRAEEVPCDAQAFAHAAAAYKSMNATDPKAIWLYQGGLFGQM